MDPPPTAEPPPPAYGSDHDYDRKISDALQRSLTISPQLQPPSTSPEDEEWEEWDEAKFEMAAARAQEGFLDDHTKPSSEKELLARQDALRSERTSGEASSSTSPPSTADPLNIARRLPVSPPMKEQPSWLADAQLTTSAASTSSSGQASSSTSPPPAANIAGMLLASPPTKEQPSWLADAQLTTSAPSTSSSNFQLNSHHLPPEEEDPDEPLPAFAAVGPSLEGPPFEDVVREPRRFPQGADADSPPESPLDSVADSDILPAVPPFPLPSDRRSSHDGHRSTPPRQPMLPQMIRTAPFPSSSHRPPSMRFDPSVAYKKPCALDTIASDNDSKPPVDAYALYNSAVSSLMGRPPPPKKRISPLNQDTPANSSTYPPGVAQDTYSQAPQIPLMPPPQPPPIPMHNPHYPTQNHTYYPNQYAPYSQPQQQQVYIPSQGYAQGAPPGAPTHWQPSSNMHGPGHT